MKKRIALLLAAIMCLSLLAACGEKTADDDAADAITIAYFGPHQNNEYQISLREAVEAACAAQGRQGTALR